MFSYPKVILVAAAVFNWQVLWEETVAESSYNKRRSDWSEMDWVNFINDSCWQNRKKKNISSTVLNFDALLKDEKFLVEFDRLKRFVDKDTSVLDVGAGTGRLAIPLARIADKVTVLEPSHTNQKLMRDNAVLAGVDNLEYIESLWSDFEIPEKYDLVFSVWSPAIRDPPSLLKMNQASKGLCALITSALPYGNMDFLNLIYPLVRKEPYKYVYNFAHVITTLYQHGIYPNIETWKAEAEMKYETEDEAVSYWKPLLMYYSDVTNEVEEMLRDYYRSRMNHDGSYCYATEGVACMIWWHV
ncbi:MAG: class I SAM-dependent methyltransferase [Methanothrix sp.]|nr:class I SAM-dependent methyltransferase [Methanothrix sp.]